MIRMVPGSIEVRDNGVEILNAPEDAEVSLAVLIGADPRLIRLRGGALVFGTAGVRYWIKGYNQDRCTLELTRADCSECGAQLPAHSGLCSRLEALYHETGHTAEEDS